MKLISKPSKKPPICTFEKQKVDYFRPSLSLLPSYLLASKPTPGALMKSFLILVLSMFVSFSAFAQGKFNTIKVDETRTIFIKGQIGGNSLGIAGKIDHMADGVNMAPIDLVVNSGGGSVIMGAQILSAMRAAQARGYTVRCFVPVIAASMAFQVLAMCDERYALKNSLLLWHPMKTSTDEPMDSEKLLYLSERLQAFEIPFMRDLIEALKISQDTFDYHRRHETLWMANEFNNLSPNFIVVVDDIQGVKDLFSMTDESVSPF